jgi:hypothetical protein
MTNSRLDISLEGKTSLVKDAKSVVQTRTYRWQVAFSTDTSDRYRWRPLKARFHGGRLARNRSVDGISGKRNRNR